MASEAGGGAEPAGKPRQIRQVREVPVAATICLVVIGVLFLVLAVFYFAEPAPHLPALIPGHDMGLARRRTKHGAFAAVVAVAALVAAWLSTGTSDVAPPHPRRAGEKPAPQPHQEPGPNVTPEAVATPEPR